MKSERYKANDAIFKILNFPFLLNYSTYIYIHVCYLLFIHTYIREIFLSVVFIQLLNLFLILLFFIILIYFQFYCYRIISFPCCKIHSITVMSDSIDKQNSFMRYMSSQIYNAALKHISGEVNGSYYIFTDMISAISIVHTSLSQN